VSRKYRSALLALAGLALSVLVVGIERGLDTLGIAAAYKAKMLCSGVFVANRQPSDVLPELEIDDLAPLRFIRTNVDQSQGTVRASALVVRRQTDIKERRRTRYRRPRPTIRCGLPSSLSWRARSRNRIRRIVDAPRPLSLCSMDGSSPNGTHRE
jgi:hypothetical protein